MLKRASGSGDVRFDHFGRIQFAVFDRLQTNQRRDREIVYAACVKGRQPGERVPARSDRTRDTPARY